MTRIVLDADLRKKLLNLTEHVVLTDDEGKIVAHILPCPDPTQWQWESPTDEAELQRRQTSNEPRYSFEQMMEHLRKL
jgi:hypothetical protein